MFREDQDDRLFCIAQFLVQRLTHGTSRQNAFRCPRRRCITYYPLHERLYGGWFESIVVEDAKNAVIRSADRYVQALVSEA